MKKKKGFSLKNMMMLVAIVPMLVSILILGGVSIAISRNSLEKNVNEELEFAAYALREYYEYDLINEVDLVDGFCEYDPAYIDVMTHSGIDLTLFNKDVRFMTSIKDASGNRIEGTKAAAEIWDKVSKGETVYQKGVKINGTEYYVYYLPIGNEGNVLGMAFAGKPATDVKAAEQGIFFTVILTAVLMGLLFSAIVYWIARRISVPMAKVTDSIEGLANGDTNIKMDLKSTIAETNLLLGSSRKMGEKLHAVIGDVLDSTTSLESNAASLSENSERIATTSHDVSTAVEEIATGATQQATEIQNIVNNVMDMSNALTEISDSTRDLNAAVSTMEEASSLTSGNLENLKKSADTTSTSVENISSSVQNTRSAVDNIGAAVALIDSIASQTNLLSLNASIEAARAGEAGKGFAVVADEIRSLAEQSAGSARQIQDYMRQLTEEADNTVVQSDSMKDIIAEQQEVISETVANVEKMIAGIEAISQASTIVDTDVEKCSAARSTIDDAVSALSAISEENAASAQETSASMTELSSTVSDLAESAVTLTGVVKTLEDSVSYFKV